MNIPRMLMGLVFSVGILGLGMSGCGEEPGTAEKAGKEIDSVMEKAGDAMSEAKEEVMEEAGEMVEKAEEMAHSEEEKH